MVLERKLYFFLGREFGEGVKFGAGEGEACEKVVVVGAWGDENLGLGRPL